jgi:DNA-binding transcriptional ArsR family regulator
MTKKPDVRQITDSRVLAAMAHPLRRRLVDLLKVEGPATASVLAERTGEAIGNISHHMKVLAASELVEEAPELARDRRERWWRLVSSALRWSVRDFADDPAGEAVALAAASLGVDRQLQLLNAWRAASPEIHAAWSEGPFSTDSWLRLSPDELARFSQELIGLIRSWADRDLPEDGVDREPVFVFAHGFPARP